MSIEEAALLLSFAGSPTACIELPARLSRKVSPLIHIFAESELIKDRGGCDTAFLNGCRFFLELRSATKLGRQDTMTAIEDSKFVHSAIVPAIPSIDSVSTVRRISKTMVMEAQQKTPARPTFAVMRI